MSVLPEPRADDLDKARPALDVVRELIETRTRRRQQHHIAGSREAEGPRHAVNWSYIKDNIRERIGEFLFIRTERRPMILPVVIEV